jgi:hypothetical protein
VIERPRVSPDGQLIVFSMGDESRANLYTIPASGGTPKPLTFLNAFSIAGVWSPDGRSVAFALNEGNKARVWLVHADGSSVRPLPGGDVSDTFDLSWAPGARLLVQQEGNRNYYVLDSRTEQQRLLVQDSHRGWIASPVYSPDGSRIVVGWNRPPARGMSVIDSQTLREAMMYEVSPDSEALPIGWSPDGTYVYAFDGKRAAYRGALVPFELTMTEARILQISVSGGQAKTKLSLPFEEVGSVTVFPDGRRFLCTVYSSRSDVWIVEGFDAPLDRRTLPRSSTIAARGDGSGAK